MKRLTSKQARAIILIHKGLNLQSVAREMNITWGNVSSYINIIKKNTDLNVLDNNDRKQLLEIVGERYPYLVELKYC